MKTDGKNKKVPDYPICQLDSEENILSFKFKVPTKLVKFVLGLLLLSRRVRFGYRFRRIALTQGKYAIVDPEDYEKLVQYKWYAKKGVRTYYALHSVTNGGKQKRINLHMHHLVINVSADMYCDHVNHNGLDNRKANLRAATAAQNVWNRRKFKKVSLSSEYIGVDWCKSVKKYRARIRVKGTRIHLGSFESAERAAKAYDGAARQYHGRFASTNFK